MYLHDISDQARACGVFLFVCYLAWSQESSLNKEVQALLEAKVAMNGEARVHAILSHLCDAVLELDGALIIRGETRRFDAMMMSGRSCQGRPFVDFVETEDQQRLVQFLNSAIAGSVTSCTTHIVLPQSGRVKVTISHTFSKDLDGQSCHLLGLQEARQKAVLLPYRSRVHH